MRKQILRKVFLTMFCLGILGLFGLHAKPALAANPTTINFQGKIVNLNGTNVTPDGTYSIVFRIYNTSAPTMTSSCTSTASCLWQETQASVQVTNGVFQVELGSACALTSSSCSNSAGGPISFSTSNSLYLTMQFNGDTSGSNGGFMSPTIHITSVPFALQADNSSTLDGLAAGNFVQLAQGLQTDSSTTNASIALNKTNSSGTPDILLLQKSGKNALEVNNSGTTLLGQAGASGLNGTLTFNNSAGTNTVSLSLQADPGSSYTLLLPTTGPSTSQCLQTDATTANQLKFASCSAGSGTALSINGGAVGASANLIDTTATSSVAGIAYTNSSGTITTALSNADGTHAGAISAGSQTIGGDKIFQSVGANSATEFQIRNAAGSTVLNADTTASTGNNLVANSSFESALSSWSALGSGSPTQVTTSPYEQTHDLSITTTTSANDGAKYTTGSTFLSASTTYTLAAYVRTDSTLAQTSFEMGHADDGTTPTFISCLSGQTLTTGWKRFSCTWTSGGTITGNPFIYFRKTASGTGSNFTIYVDDIQLQTDDATAGRNTTTTYQNAAINLTGTSINSPLVIQTASNTTNALQVQNAVGMQIFNVDTTDSNLISNNDFEVNSSGWTAVGSGTAIRRDTSQSYTGFASLQIITGTAADSGAQFTLNPVVTRVSTTYTVSFYARRASGDATNFTDLIARYSADGTLTAGHFSDCGITAMNSQTVASTGWTRYYCAVSSTTAPTTSGYILIKDTSSGTAHTFYIDGVQLEETTAANITDYGAGSISINATINSPLSLQSISNSTTAFQIQNASGTAVLGIDTTNFNLFFGNTTNSNQIKLASGATSATYTITLPTAVSGGTAYCLTSNTGGTTTWTACGAGATATVTLVPEFLGAVMTGDGATNSGTMTSDFCSGSSALNINSTICDGATTKQHNYYSWTSTGANDYDIWIRWQVPSDFNSFGASNPISWSSRKSASGDDVKMNIYTNAGATCGTGTSMTNTSGSWQTSNYSNSGCTPAAGDILVIDLHLVVAANTNTVQMGEIPITYNRN